MTNHLFLYFLASRPAPFCFITHSADSPKSFAILLTAAFNKIFTYSPALKLPPAGAYGEANR